MIPLAVDGMSESLLLYGAVHILQTVDYGAPVSLHCIVINADHLEQRTERHVPETRAAHSRNRAREDKSTRVAEVWFT